MLIGSDRKLRAATAIYICLSMYKKVEGFGHFKYLGVTLSSNFTWTEPIECFNEDKSTLLRRIKSLLPSNGRIFFFSSLILLMFDYADIVWGDKDNAVLMNNLQLL